MVVDFGDVRFDRAILVRGWRSCIAIPCTSVSVFIVKEKADYLSLDFVHRRHVMYVRTLGCHR